MRASASASASTVPQAKRAIVDPAETPEEAEEEDGASEEVEDTVPDHFSRGGDDIAALGASPADEVEREEEGEIAGAAEVSCAHDTTCGKGRAPAVPEENIPK